jgi:Uncharacterized protein involved in methicillin resistance
MSITVAVTNPLENQSWDDRLLSNEQSSFFHTSFWARVLADTYHFSPRYFALVKDDHLLISWPIMEIRNVPIKKKAVSLPFSDYCDPIITGEISFHEVFRHITEYGKRAGWQSIEIRGCTHFGAKVQPSCFNYGHTLRLLSDDQKIFAGFKDSTKRNIRKAIKEGVEVSIHCSYESVKEFCKLNSLTRKRHGLPPQPFLFFKNIFRHILSRNQGFIVLATYEEKTIAGAVYFYFNKRALYKYGASDLSYQNLRANNLVMWEAIRWFCNNGFATLCFGRTEPENDGLRQFKQGWNTEERIMHDYLFDLKKEQFIKRKQMVSGLHNHVFRSLPVWMLKIIGSAIYKYMA